MYYASLSADQPLFNSQNPLSLAKYATALWNKLSDSINEEQRAHKISNLITKMRRNGQIMNRGLAILQSGRLQNKA